MNIHLTLHCVLFLFYDTRPGMVASLAEKAASYNMSIENMTTSLRIGKDGSREFVIDALVSSPDLARMDHLDSIVSDLSTLKADLGLSHFDVFVHTEKQSTLRKILTSNY